MSQERPRLWCELCCGSAAVTLKLLGGRYAVPPISYMGSKRGYAETILGIMGLRCGIGADSVLLCDAGPWAHVWAVLANQERCHEVAAILRGWADEDPRELWERLREEHRGEWDGWTVERAAGWAVLQSGTWGTAGLFRHDDQWRMIGGIESAESGGSCTGRPVNPSFKGSEAAGVNTLAHRLESVAAWLQVGAWSYEQGNQKTGFCGPGERRQDTTATATATATAKTNAAVRQASSGLSIYAGPAEDIEPPGDCEGVYLYLDPPYLNTTGYQADMPRETVLDVARKWSDAGAVVCVSEAQPLPLDGWHHVDIAGTRIGQRRTFSKCQSEWLTINREPAWKPAIQETLFG